jgi:hypothetical protein
MYLKTGSSSKIIRQMPARKTQANISLEFEISSSYILRNFLSLSFDFI